MYYKKLMLVVVSAMLGASFVQEASAWGTGGSIGTPRKSFADLKLYCNLSDPNSTATITTTPSNLAPLARPSFKFAGQIVCAEVLAATATPSLSDAITLNSGGKAVGKFDLVQVTDPIVFPGLIYAGPISAVDDTRTWLFDVAGRTSSFPYAEALWKLVPIVDGAPGNNADKFCNPVELGVLGVPAILDSTNCQALFGLKTLLPLMASDYGGVLGLGAGQVFKFQTVTKNSVERAAEFKWAPCHTIRFIGPVTPTPQAGGLNTNSADVSPRTGGSVTGSGLLVELLGSPITGDLFVMTQPNDLWAFRPNGWSNANGIPQDVLGGVLFSSAAYKANIAPFAPGDYLSQLDAEVKALLGPFPIDNIGVASTGLDPSLSGGFIAPPGMLVGQVQALGGGATYHQLGTGNATAITVGALDELRLFYWDINSGDNHGSAQVTVARDLIQCAVAGEPINAQGELTGNTPVTVIYNPTLNVDNKSSKANFPVTVVGCTNYDPSFTIGPDGSPIISDDVQVKINGTQVTYTGFHVADSVSYPSCDNGLPLGEGTPDLRVDVNQKSVIAVLAPDGACTNGVHDYKLEIGSNTNGWFAGTGQLELKKCN